MFTLRNITITKKQLLKTDQIFIIKPLQLYTITEQLQQKKPTYANKNAKTNLKHILNFTYHLKYLKIKLKPLIYKKTLNYNHTTKKLIN